MICRFVPFVPVYFVQVETIFLQFIICACPFRLFCWWKWKTTFCFWMGPLEYFDVKRKDSRLDLFNKRYTLPSKFGEPFLIEVGFWILIHFYDAYFATEKRILMAARNSDLTSSNIFKNIYERSLKLSRKNLAEQRIVQSRSLDTRDCRLYLS